VIPQLVTAGYRGADGRLRRLHVPVLPVVLLLSPLLVLALLAGVVAGLVLRISPVGALRGLGRLLWALPGTRIDIDDPATTMQIHIR
jgi:hypothetical protein